ncbi:galactosylceramide sulfotransferase [Branchiostoma belcheri]|nr:galactosylceramide sulfotransferase [Branchiostoma belcheri]
MWNLPCKKKLGTVTTGLLILVGIFILLIHNIGIGQHGNTTRSSSEDENLRNEDEIQEDSDIIRASTESTEDATTSDADNSHDLNEYIKHRDTDNSYASNKYTEDRDADDSAASNKYIEHRVSKAPEGADGLNGQCKMKKSILFMKVHKAGSHTTVCILQRFGYEHGLNFVLPKKCPSVNLGFPGGMTDDILMHQDVDEYNLLVHHTVYDRVKFHKLMAPDTQFVTILREPLSHLKSCFFYFSRDKKFALAGEKNPLGKYLDNPWRYEGSTRAKKARASMTMNLQSFVLGWKDRFNKDPDDVRKFLSQLDSDFPLVLILEYFDASLVLLKRLMCWTFYNILYDMQPRNEQKYTKKESAYTEQQLLNHRNASFVDYQLYEHFNKSLWAKIEAAGQDFQDELEAFQQLNDDVNSYCKRQPTEKKIFPGSKWNGPVEIKPSFCQDLKLERIQWDVKICQRAGGYGKGKMRKKQAKFQKMKAKKQKGNPPPATRTDFDEKLQKSEIDQFLAGVQKAFPGMGMNDILKKSGIPASKVVLAIRQGRYTVEEAVKMFKSRIQSKKN